MQTRDVQETPLQAEAKRLVVKLACLGGLLSAVAAVEVVPASQEPRKIGYF